MKKTFVFTRYKMVCIAIMLCSIMMHGQDIPKIVPPSPNASAFHVYGNTQVNYYTGSPNIQIPIYTIKEGDLTLPIYLKYTGGNGIKVEEIASWVGLGWTLNTGGAISRVRRGKVDEDPNNGYLHINNLPSLDIKPNGQYVDYFNLDQTLKGKRDTEPDLFMYNFPTGSGEFFIKHNKEIFFKPQKDVKVAFSNTSKTETISNNYCRPFDGILGKFTATDKLGYIYEFDERERNTSVSANVPMTDKRAFPSTWFLTKMLSPKTSKSIDFTYEGYFYDDKRLSANMTFSGFSQTEREVYTSTYYIGKRLKTITFSQGTIDFISSVNTRKDLKGDKSLKEIVIKDTSGNLIKRFVFSYKYMTSNALIDENSVTTFSNKNRLILNSIIEYDTQGVSKPAYQFTYNTNHKLPSRDSKSKDHWGYYNGKLNQRHLPKHYVERYDRTSGRWVDEAYGSADRSVSPTHEQAGILTSITYPTGGKTSFSYESHTADSSELLGDIKEKSIALGFPGSKQVIDVQLSSLPISKVRINNLYRDFSSNKCYVIFHIKNLANGTVSSYVDKPNTRLPEIFLEAGRYEVWYTLDSDVSNFCNEDDPALIIFFWENENSSSNKLVGGVRIKTIKDITEGKEITKVFNYNASSGITSGSLVTVPKYSFLKLKRYFAGYVPGTNNKVGYYKLQPEGTVHHSIPSLYPLVNTQGSPVGYEKVTVSFDNNQGGKTEYYYSTAEEFPDTFEGKFMQYNLDRTNGNKYYTSGYKYANKVNFLGRSIDIYPIVSPDSKEFLRGLLKKEIHYKNQNGLFSVVNEKENFYDNLYFSRNGLSPGLIDNYIDQEQNYIEGISTINTNVLCDGSTAYGFQPSSCNVSNFKYYDIYTGYTASSKTIEKQHFDNNSTKTITTYKYLKDTYYNLFIESFTPRETETINSKGEVLKTKTLYADDVNDQRLKTEHRIAEPIEVTTFKNGVQLSHQKTGYASNHNTSNLYLPKFIKTLKGISSAANQPEDRVVYHSYDTKGNPTEVSKKEGTHIVYIWGYHDTQPVAKIEAAKLSGIPATYINAIKTASNFDNDRTQGYTGKEGNLRKQLNKLHQISALKNAQITYFTYDPLVGVTSITDPRGETAYYEYDTFNRLSLIKNAQGHILKEHNYHYKN